MVGKPAGLSGPTREFVRERLSTLLQEICQRFPEEIHDAATIDRELEMESVQMVELQVAIETEFDITLDFLEVLRLNSFRRVTDYIHQLTCTRAES
jgi:acyl carrier protein